MKFTPTITKDVGTALDIILSLFGLPTVCKNVSTGIALIQQAIVRDTSPDGKLKELFEQIATAINTISKNEVSEEDRQAVLLAVKSSLEKFKQNSKENGKDIKNIFSDNINSPEVIIEQVCVEHRSLGGVAEDCYQNIIRIIVTALCKPNNVELFLNQNYALVKLIQNNDEFRETLDNTSVGIEKIAENLNKLIEDRCLTESKLPFCNTTNSFHYLNTKIKFQGRKEELKEIEKFMLDEKPFTFWSVTGKGGTGKSKFALHIAEKYVKRGWVVIWCESETDYNNIFRKEFIQPTLFIFDYAGSSTQKIHKVLYEGSQKSEKQKIRLLFVERDKYGDNRTENWYTKIFSDSEYSKYKYSEYRSESINLGSLDDNSIKDLLDNFAEVRAKELGIAKNTLSVSEKQQIIDYVRKTLPRKDEKLDFADRCLFILFTADACLRGKDYSNWDAEELLSNYIKQYISKLPKAIQLDSHLNLLAIATATGGIDIENYADIPVLSEYVEKLITEFDYENNVSRGQEFIRCLCEKEESNNIITPMYPDLVGEYFFISRISNLLESIAKSWINIFLNEKYKDYFVTFLARSLEDWYSQSKLHDFIDWVLEALESNPDYALAYLLPILALIHHSKGDYTSSVKYLKKAKDIFEKLLPKNNPYLASTYNNLGTAYDDNGDYTMAIEFYEKALDIHSDNHPYLAGTYNNLGNAYRNKGDYDKAIEFYEKALKIQEVLPDNHPDLAGTYNNLGSAYADKGDYDKAIEFYEKALKIKEEVLPDNHPNLASVYNNLGGAYTNKGNLDKAIEFYEKALKIKEEVLPDNHPDLALTYNNLGVAYRNKGDYDKAIEFYEKALTIFKTALPNTHPYTIGVYENIIRAFLKKSDEENALKYYDEMKNFCK